MPKKSKKFNPFKNTVKTVMHWYTEVQDLPDTLNRRVETDIVKAQKLIHVLKTQLSKANNSLKKTREKKIDAAARVKIKATQAAKKSLAKSKAVYNRVSKTISGLNKKIEKAQSQLNHAKIRQTYYQALAKSFSTVTDLFQKKHSTKKSTAGAGKKRKKTSK